MVRNMQNSNHITIKKDNTPIYDIVLAEDYTPFLKELDALHLAGRKVCIVTDSNVSKLHLNNLLEIVKDYAKVVETFTFPAGEDSKTLATVELLYEKLIQSNFDRNDMLFALGGGVVGDLTGYAAATYLRGIAFIQIPTTLLACVDSSIGGKTGVDFKAYKNMVGAFHQPKLVYINLAHLYTLDDRQFCNGMGEVIKHGLIKDIDYYEWLKSNRKAILERDLHTLKEMVLRSCEIKQMVVEIDPTEKGVRALLNFGHTLGHSIERLMEFKLLHGECISIGMTAAAYLSKVHGYMNKEEVTEIADTLISFKLPVNLIDTDIPSEEFLRVCFHDKKVDGNLIKFILLKEKGNAVIDTSVSRDEILDAVNCIKKTKLSEAICEN
jgi:3-dehydroquinate synthase